MDTVTIRISSRTTRPRAVCGVVNFRMVSPHSTTSTPISSASIAKAVAPVRIGQRVVQVAGGGAVARPEDRVAGPLVDDRRHHLRGALLGSRVAGPPQHPGDGRRI